MTRQEQEGERGAGDGEGCAERGAAAVPAPLGPPSRGLMEGSTQIGNFVFFRSAPSGWRLRLSSLLCAAGPAAPCNCNPLLSAAASSSPVQSSSSRPVLALGFAHHSIYSALIMKSGLWYAGLLAVSCSQCMYASTSIVLLYWYSSINTQ